jgi:hypothetical protein
MRHKHLTVYEIRKPPCKLSVVFVLRLIMYSGVWGLGETELWPAQHRIAAVELFIKT